MEEEVVVVSVPGSVFGQDALPSAGSVAGREVELVLLLSTPVLKAGEVERARVLVGELLDWNRVMGMLVMHRTVGVAWQNIVDHGLGAPEDFTPEYVLPVLEICARGQELLAREQTVLASGLISALAEAGVPGLVLKGVALGAMAYRGLGMRLSQDVDLLVERSDLGRTHEVLTGLGYVQGTWDVSGGRVLPASRAEIVKHTVYSHETFPYVKATTDSSVMARHVVDVHFSVELNSAVGSDDVVRDLLGRRVLVEPIPGVPVSSVCAEDMFVFVSVHFAREARLRTETEELVDLVLYKLVDLVGLLAGGLDTSRLAERARQLGMEREVYFALHHLMELFPGRVPGPLAEELRPESVEYVHQVQDFASPAHKCQAPWRTWNSPIVARFFDTRRILELTGEDKDPA